MEIGINNHCHHSKPRKEGRGFLLCLFLACTLPQALCQTERKSYCNGLTDSVQVEVESDAVL
jgi:hypothetical protein